MAQTVQIRLAHLRQINNIAATKIIFTNGFNKIALRAENAGGDAIFQFIITIVVIQVNDFLKIFGLETTKLAGITITLPHFLCQRWKLLMRAPSNIRLPSSNMRGQS